MIESYIIIIGMVVDPQVVAPTVLEHLLVFVQGWRGVACSPAIACPILSCGIRWIKKPQIVLQISQTPSKTSRLELDHHPDKHPAYPRYKTAISAETTPNPATVMTKTGARFHLANVV